MVEKVRGASPLDAGWEGSAWKTANLLKISHVRPEGSRHRPLTRAKLLYDENGLYCIFRVRDRYIRCVRTRYQGQVWKDSCVEVFLQPFYERNYFNFEFNCGGTIRCSFITYGVEAEDIQLIPRSIGKQIQVVHSLPRRIPMEVPLENVWTLACHIPFAVLEHYVGELGAIPGQVWMGNLYKCADESSHPHWMSWSPLSELNFHAPWDFGSLEFRKGGS
jgi:hypothetical protein